MPDSASPSFRPTVSHTAGLFNSLGIQECASATFPLFAFFFTAVFSKIIGALDRKDVSFLISQARFTEPVRGAQSFPDSHLSGNH